MDDGEKITIPMAEYRELLQEASRRDICWYCGGKLIWQSDFNYEDVEGEGNGIVTFLICSNCEAVVKYSQKDDEEE